MKIGLQARFWLSLTALIAVFSLVVSGIFMTKTRAVHHEMLSASKQLSSSRLLSEVQMQNEALVQLIAEQLVNPLYFNEFETVRNFSTSVLDREDILYIYVFDPNGKVIHDGTETLEAFGEVLHDPQFQQALNEKRLVSITQGPILHTTVPVMAGSKLLGGVRVGLSLKDIRNTALEIENNLTDISSRSTDSLINSTVLLMVGMALVGIIVGILMFGGVVKAILTLRRVMQDVGRGRYEAGFIGIPMRRNDEIGELVASVEQMARSLASSEAKLREALAMAQSASQAKTAFMSSMSHELLTPLNAIMGFAQLMVQGNVESMSDKQLQFARQIVDGGETLQEMIHQVLDYANLESGQQTIEHGEVDIEPLVWEVLGHTRKRADLKHIELKADFDAQPLPRLHTDQHHLKRILTNLLSNAVKFNAEGGWIHVTVSRHQRDGRDYVRFAIEDNGEGIAELHHEDVFAPFNRSGREKLAVSGAGLGLTISSKLAELLDGEMGFESQEGQGSVFWIDLPLNEDA